MTDDWKKRALEAEAYIEKLEKSAEYWHDKACEFEEFLVKLRKFVEEHEPKLID